MIGAGTTDQSAAVTAYHSEVPAVGRSATSWLRRHPGLVVVLLVPLVVFAAPLLTGSTFLDGDNFLQNFPMRALVGLDLRHHTLPLWNPYLFSGTPLLGGFNAGAAYPTTWLMAVLPIFTAWTLNLAIAYDVAILGMYAFLRRQAISLSAATFGAAAFAFSGYMTAQLVHIDLVAAAAWLPWMLVAVHAVTDGRPDGSPTAPGWRRRPTRYWIGLLALAVGMSILTGGTEAIIDSGILVAVFLIGRLFTMGYLHRSRLTALATTLGALALGVAAGVALGAAQLVPGLAFQSQSQRAATTYAFFSTGSLPARLLTLVATPFLLGTGRGQPGYAGPYNFQEVTSFVGVLALIAACSLVVRRWRRRPEARHWWVWYVVLALGALSALGAQTPFGHVLFLVPVVRGERLLNRNLLLVDFSLVVLFAWWVHLLLEDRAAGDTGSGVGDRPLPLRHRWQPGRRSELIATCAPAAVIVALCLFLWLDGPLLDRLLQTQFPIDRTARWQDAGLVTLGALIAVGATWLVLTERRFSRTRLRQLLALVLAADLILFNGFVIHPPITQSLARGQGSLAPSLTSAVGDGRFIIYNPDQFYDNELYELAQTDLNIFNRLGSGQGYTALTDANYVDATGAHYQEDLNPATLAGPTWDQLNVRTLLTLPSYFVTPVSGGAGASAGAAPAPVTSTPFPADLNLYNSAPTPEPPPVTLRPGQAHRWYFGGLLTVASWAVPVPGGTPSGWRAGVLTATGGIRWLPSADVVATGSTANRSLRVAPPAPVRAAGLVIENQADPAATVGVPTARTAEAGDVALRGRMQYGVTWPHWRFSGTIGSFGVFQNADPLGWAWAGGPGGAPASGTSVTAGAPGSDGTQQITVHAAGATTLERSVAWSPGWRATIRPTGPAVPGGNSASASASTVPVQRDGVIQRVAIPKPGDYLVSFSYAPASAAAGLIVSAVAAVGFVIWAGWELVVSWRRRRRLNPG